MSKATITIDGNTGRDPEVTFSQAGKAIAKFSVAVTDRRKDGDTWVDGDTQWFQVVAFGALAEDVAEGVEKGAKVVVGGRFKLDEWTDKEGNARSTPTILADWVGVKPRRVQQDRQQSRQQDRRPARRQSPRVEYDDAEVPY